MLMNFDIIGWGALNVDRLCQVNKFAPEDGETFIYNETKTCGGSAANTIIGTSKLGLNTGYIGKIGTDTNGKMMKEMVLEYINLVMEIYMKENGKMEIWKAMEYIYLKMELYLKDNLKMAKKMVMEFLN